MFARGMHVPRESVSRDGSVASASRTCLAWRSSGASAVKNGLYSIHVTLGDGRSGKGSGVLVCRDGWLRGGDSYLHYVGIYELRGGTIFGEVVINQHTPSPAATPLFGGRQVGIGFTGRETETRILLDGTALVGRDSAPFRASMMFLCDLEEPEELPASGA